MNLSKPPIQLDVPVQVMPAQLPNPAAPLVNGTYHILSLGRTEACQNQTPPQYLARYSNCVGSSTLFTTPLRDDNVLELKWDVGLVPGKAGT